MPETTAITEILMAAPQPDGQWLFGGVETSGLFRYTMTEDWNERMDAPYYKEFWEPLHDQLNNHDRPVEIIISAEYTFGTSSDEELRKMMEVWRIERTDLQPNFLTVTHGEHSVSFSRLEIKDFDIKVARIE